MQAIATQASPKRDGTSVRQQLPIIAVVFLGFLVVGLALPVLPIHVHHDLGMGTFIVGLVTGSQFATALATRMWAGSYADTKGAKRAVVAGLLAAAVAGVLYMLSLEFSKAPAASVATLLLGRSVLGGGESFMITGALGWGVALSGQGSPGKVMAWMGTAMYAAFAAGAPIGTALFSSSGFAAIASATILIPIVTLVGVSFLKATPPTAKVAPSFLRVLRSVWVPGLGLALSSIGFGAITAFVSLLFVQRQWSPGWPAFTAFATCFIVARVVLGGSIDKLGAVRIGVVSLVVEAAGQLLIWSAQAPWVAILGAALTGLGYSLIYPAFGVEAVRRAPPESRALAMGAYTSCLDLALGLGTPALGLIAGWGGLSSCFLIGAVVVLSAIPIALRLQQTRASS